MRRKPQLRPNQQGFASVVIALVLIIVLALLTVGFAQLARREQTDSLHKQLASQANYAAESGINDAYKDIIAGRINESNTTGQFANKCLTASGPNASANSSKSLPSSALSANPIVNAGNDVSYTCLLVTLATPDIKLDNVPPTSGQHATIGTSAPPSYLTISWGSAEGANNFPATSVKFPPQSGWHNASNNPYAPVVAFSLTPLSGSETKDSLVNNTFNVYLYPASSGGSCADSRFSSCVTTAGGQGQIAYGNCNPSGPNRSRAYPCSVTILAPASATSYLMHVQSFYANNLPNVSITGAGAGGPITFTGEPIIDVTGKAKDVLKRLQVRILTSGSNGGPNSADVLPGNAIEAQNVCKRFGTEPNSTNFDSGTSSACNLTD